MNLISKLSDAELLAKTKSLVKEEKRITQEVLNHIDLSIKNLNPVKHKFTTAAVAGGSKDLETAKVHSMSATRYISAALEHYIWVRDQGCCQYFDKVTGRKCESKFALQIDHIHPFSLGGTNEKENLRLLGRAHNIWRTRELYKH
jgi:HNH endonuclease